MHRLLRKVITAAAICLTETGLLVVGSVKLVTAAAYPFPVIGDSSFSNDFNASRSSGPHHAIDIIAKKRQKIISRTDGIVSFVAYPQPSWGYAVFIRADNGYEYRYLHMNNDTPGTDNGSGGGYYAYAPDIERGKRVVKGQLLGYVGDSGNAEDTVSHLHFEVYDGERAINPYNGLVNNSYKRTSPVIEYPRANSEMLPYSSFTGGASITYGDVDGDGTDEIITGAGPGGNYVKAFELSGQQITRFAPNGTVFTGGVDVASGDVDGDGTDEIITGAGKGGRYIKVFELSGQQIGSFLPNGREFMGGVDVATGDIDGDNTDEIITGAGPGGNYVKAFELSGQQIVQFAPYGLNSSAGVTVSAGDVAGTGADEIVTGARKGGGPRVSIFTISGERLDTYYAYDSAFKGGIRVESANVRPGSSRDEIVTLPQTNGLPRVKIFAATGSYIEMSSIFAEEWWKGYYDIAATDGGVLSSTGVNRRTSLRFVTGLQN